MAINIPIISSLEGKGFEQAALQLKALETNGERAGFVMEKAFLPAVAALGALAVVGGLAVKAAIDDEAAQAILANTLKNVTDASDAQVASVEASITAMQRATGVADDELRPAFANLVTGTKDILEANKLLSLAMDISAGSGADLASVSDALAKAYGGNTKALGALSPEIKAMMGDGASLNTVMDTLGKTFGGSAATAAGTAKGQFKILNIQIGELQESIGYALLPVLTDVLPLLTAFGDWAGNNVGVIMAIGTMIAAAAAAVVAYKIALLLANAVTVVSTALNWGLAASAAAANTAMTLGVGAAAIAAGLVVTAGAFLIYKNATKDSTKATALATDGASILGRELDLQDKQLSVVQQEHKAFGEQLKKTEEELKKAAESSGTVADKAKEMAARVKDASNALEKYMVTSLKNAQDELEKATNKFTDFATTVSDGIKDAFSFSDAKTAGDETGKGFLQGLRDQVAGIIKYGADVQTLLKSGLSQEALKAVLEAGGKSGAAIAMELIKGGTTAIDETNALVASAQAAADLIGQSAAQQWYGAGVSNAQSYLQGIEAAFAEAQKRLGKKGLRLPDVKGIGASFGNAVTGPMITPVAAPSFGGRPEQGQNVVINVTGGLGTSLETAKLVVDNLTQYTQVYGPLNVAIR